jgi:hypothetical protein
MVPYVNYAAAPSVNVMNLKLTEGILELLNANQIIAATLFDFVDP